MQERIRGIVSELAVAAMLLVLVLNFGAISNPAAATYTPSWATETPMGEGRAQACIVQDENGLVYVIGGMKGAVSTAINNVTTYNLETGAWTEVAPLPVAVRGATGAVGTDGRIYVFGGTSSVGLTQIYDPELDSWSGGANMPVSVWLGRAAAMPYDTILVFGGYDNNAMANTNVVQIYYIDTDSWGFAAPMPQALCGGGLAVWGSSAYYTGGSHVTWNDATDVLYEYSYWYDSWTVLTPMPSARASHASVMGVDNLIYVLGGGPSSANYAPENFHTGVVYNLETDEWTSLPNMTVASRHLGAAMTDDGKIFALGGSNGTACQVRVESLQIATATASVMPSTVGQGRPVMVSVEIEFAYLENNWLQATAYVISSTGSEYGSINVVSNEGGPAYGVMTLPQSVPVGSYTVKFVSIAVQTDVGTSHLGDMESPLTVVAADSFDQQIDALQNDIAALQARLAAADGNVTVIAMQLAGLSTFLTSLQTQLDGMQDQVDRIEDKADAAGMYAMINLALIVIVLVLLVLLFVLARKGGK